MLKRFLSELRHRRVLRSAIAYAIVAAAVVEFTDIVTPALYLGEELLRVVIIIALVGLPVIMVLAWFFDLTGVVTAAVMRQRGSRHEPCCVAHCV